MDGAVGGAGGAGGGEAITAKLAQLPEAPGVYLFRDAAGTLLYVGKAVSLRSRVRSYFQSGRGLETKTQRLVAVVADLEWIVTDSEVEALLVENNLIKQHRPKFNIRLRDDKQYPYLRLDLTQDWPTLQLVRRPASDGARYFGPYPHSAAVWETMAALRRVFPYRSCSDRRLRQPHPCLYHHIHRCLAPCIAACTPQAYRDMATQLTQFLEGKGADVLDRLEAQMHEAAEALRFEDAAQLRDRLAALRSVLEKQKVQRAGGKDRDALAVARGPHGEAAVQIFFFREGKLAGREGHLLDGGEGRTDGEVLSAFVQQYYGGGGAAVPAELLVGSEPADPDALTALLRRCRGAVVRLHVPRRGEKRQVVEMVRRNAEAFLEAQRWQRERSRDAIEAAMGELVEVLGLGGPPRRIECYDNSNLHGQHPVAAMVVLEDGVPCKAEYRKFKVRSVRGPDDFATMEEILGRRFARAARERLELAEGNPDGEVPPVASGFARLPDLVLIDGGRGQLSHARAAMRAVGMERIPTFALAKENEWIFAEDRAEPIVLARTSPALRMLQRARDEAHRFGLGFHRQLRGRAAVASVLEDAPGIGPRRRKALLQAFGSLAAIRDAAPEALAAVRGMSRAAAEDLLQYLRQGADDRPPAHP